MSGEPRTIEIWFGLEGETVYMLSGGGDASNWVKNLTRTPEVSVRIGAEVFEGRARPVAPDAEEDGRARRLLLDKYRSRYSGDLEHWGRTALPVAVDVAVDRTPVRTRSG